MSYPSSSNMGNEKKTHNNQNVKYFLINDPQTLNNTTLFEDPQVLPTCPHDNGRINMKMNM